LDSETLHCSSISGFKCRLKTLLFRQTFSSTTWTVRQRLWSHPTCWRYINESIIIIIITKIVDTHSTIVPGVFVLMDLLCYRYLCFTANLLIEPWNPFWHSMPERHDFDLRLILTLTSTMTFITWSTPRMSKRMSLSNWSPTETRVQRYYMIQLGHLL